jgi:hypothetical protein
MLPINRNGRQMCSVSYLENEKPFGFGGLRQLLIATDKVCF